METKLKQIPTTIKIEIEWFFISPLLSTASGMLSIYDATNILNYIPLEEYLVTVQESSLTIKTKKYTNHNINYFSIFQNRIKSMMTSYLSGLIEKKHIYDWI